MKKVLKKQNLILVLELIFVLIFNTLFPIISNAADENVSITFQDENLYNAIMTALDGKIASKDEANKNITITQSNLETITTLDLNSKEIINIEGIDKFTFLNELYLYKNKISDISPLSELTNLSKLDLGINKISDITKIAKLTNLNYLSLCENEISDISVVSKMTKLEYLNLQINKISNISSVSGLSSLKELYLSTNEISDISVLSKMTNLEKLGLHTNKISEISALSELTNLNYLDIAINKISDITPIAKLTNLNILSVSDNEISDISVVSKMTKLEDLNLQKNKISNISSVSELTNLNELYLTGNEISDISALSKLTNLEKMNLGKNKISDISPLSGLTKLNNLFLHKNEISNLSPLSKLTNLNILHLWGNKISDIAPLSELTNLTTLELGENEISNISPLSELTKLNELRLNKNKISDISALSKLTNVNIMYLQENEISDISALSGLTNINEMYLFENKISNITPLAGLTKLWKIGLCKNEISDVSPLSNLTNLKYLNLHTNKISEISSLSKLTNLEYLNLGGNTISNISALSEMTKIGELKLYKNEISDISPLSNMTYLNELYIYENKISDITPLSDLSNLALLEAQNNKISDISVLETKNIETINIKEQKIELETEKTEDIKLPNIFIQAKNEESIAYSDDELIFEGCKLNSDGTAITLEQGVTEAKVRLFKDSEDRKGVAGSEVTFKYTDVTAPDVQVKYSTTVLTNKNVKVTITSNEKIQEVEGWTLSEDKLTLTKEYSQNGEDEVVIKDLAGNERKIPVKVSNIDKTVPKAEVKYSTKELTKETVEVTIEANEKVQQVEGWTLSEDGLKLTKVYAKNATEEVVVKDLAGNETKVKVTLNNIAETIFEAKIQYSTTEATNKNITVTITSNKPMQQVEGWTLSEDKLTLTKVYTQNAEEQVTVKDLVGNEKVIPVKIKNIDTVAPKAEVEYSTKNATKETVKVTIKANEKVQQVEGWTLSNDGVMLTKTYTKNAKEEIKVKDFAGNETKVLVKVDNIDVKLPEIEIKYSTKSMTKEKVTVTLMANEKVQEVEGWTLSEDKLTLTKVYTDNIEEQVIVKDLVGNETKVLINIGNIDKIAPVIKVEYSTTEKGVTITLKSSEKVQGVEGWTLSEDKFTLTKEYVKNVKEEVIVKDLAGNETKVAIDSNNIEKEPQDNKDDNNINNDNKEDNTVANEEIPKAGRNMIIFSILAIVILGIVSYTKLNKFKDIR